MDLEQHVEQALRADAAKRESEQHEADERAKTRAAERDALQASLTEAAGQFFRLLHQLGVETMTLYGTTSGNLLQVWPLSEPRHEVTDTESGSGRATQSIRTVRVVEPGIAVDALGKLHAYDRRKGKSTWHAGQPAALWDFPSAENRLFHLAADLAVQFRDGAPQPWEQPLRNRMY